MKDGLVGDTSSAGCALGDLSEKTKKQRVGRRTRGGGSAIVEGEAASAELAPAADFLFRLAAEGVAG